MLIGQCNDLTTSERISKLPEFKNRREGEYGAYYCYEFLEIIRTYTDDTKANFAPTDFHGKRAEYTLLNIEYNKIGDIDV